MDGIKMAEKLWDLANLVTGFAITQTIATTFAMARDDLKNSLKGPRAHAVAIVATLVFSISYVLAILWCRTKGASIDTPANLQIWNAVTTGRVSGVLLFTLVALGTLYGHRKDESKGNQEFHA